MQGPSAPPLGVMVGDGSENAPGRFADRELRFRRSQYDVIMTASKTFLVLVGDHGVNTITQACLRP